MHCMVMQIVYNPIRDNKLLTLWNVRRDLPSVTILRTGWGRSD